MLLKTNTNSSNGGNFLQDDSSIVNVEFEEEHDEDYYLSTSEFVLTNEDPALDEQEEKEKRGKRVGGRGERGEESLRLPGAPVGHPFTENLTKFPGSRQHDLPRPLSCWP